MHGGAARGEGGSVRLRRPSLRDSDPQLPPSSIEIFELVTSERLGATSRPLRRVEQSDIAPVAQGIEQWFPKPCAQVRILPGAPMVSSIRGLTE